MSVTTTRSVLSRNFGITPVLVVAFLVSICGVLFLTTKTATTQYDYKNYEVELDISDLSEQKQELEAEKARLTSLVAAKESAVAMAMEDAFVSGYAAD